jgi:hypothetical protein
MLKVPALIFKLSLSLLTLGVLIWLLYRNENIQWFFDKNYQGLFFKAMISPWTWIAIVMLPLNWLVESMKWQRAAIGIEQLSISEAFKATLSGLALSMVTPGGIGDYAGRLAFLRKRERLEAFGPLAWVRIAQLWPSIFFGGMAAMLLGYRWFSLDPIVKHTIPWLWLGASSALLLFLFYPLFWISILSFAGPLRYLRPFFHRLTSYSKQEIGLWLLLSVLRYGIFVFQFYALTQAFEIVIPEAYPFHWGIVIPFILLAKTILPSFLELGAREWGVWMLFGDTPLFGPVLFAGLCLWLLNLVVPAFIGVICLVDIPLKSERA